MNPTALSDHLTVTGESSPAPWAKNHRNASLGTLGLSHAHEQALERTQPGLPLKTGHIRTRTHDYVRHGTITLFAALNYLDGKIASLIAPEHTSVEWLAFLKKLDREMPEDVTLHLIVDNYATHKHPRSDRG